jgi:hypothetical protein
MSRDETPPAPARALRYAPAASRNREPILEVLAPLLAGASSVLEVASGSGEHAVWFASQMPHLTWQPTDPDSFARASIDGWRAHSGAANVRPALTLDATSSHWPVPAADAVVCINMIHIAPWASCVGLLRGASDVLSAGGLLFLYGPFKVGGQHTALSNEAFDVDLRARNEAWGVRDLDEVIALAATFGFDHRSTVRMPANNLSVVLRRRG